MPGDVAMRFSLVRIRRPMHFFLRFANIAPVTGYSLSDLKR